MADAKTLLHRAASVLRRGNWLPLLLILSFCVGFLLHAAFWGGDGEAASTTVASAQEVTEWTCSMHPEIRRSGPGLCPKCGMQLIPVEPTTAGGLREFATSEAGIALMGVEVVAAKRRFVEATIRMVGKVEYDETRLAYITAWVPGRLDRLFVDYTGVPVRTGDHMAYIYSPDLFSAQEELIQSLASIDALRDSDVGIVRELSEGTVEAAREKLRLLGVTPEQIQRIEQTGRAEEHLTIYSPVSGIVIHKNAQEGMYVKTGTRIYTVADLSQVWIKLDAYESDLGNLRYGQTVEFTTVSYPGEVFTGTIAFIDPILTSGTRTVKVRVNASNESGKLKPGMFVKATVRAGIATGGRVMDPAMAGKWICPMHPDVIKDQAGACDICEMPLVRSESLGFVSAEPTPEDMPLVVPVSAVLKTGTRAVVYVQQPDAEKPTFEGQEILLGARAGDYYLVRNGLAEGELVVVQGNFKIDSALQILAKPSMMSPEGGGGGGGHDHGGGSRAPAGDEGAPPAQALPAMVVHQIRGVVDAASAAEMAVAAEEALEAREAFAALQVAIRAVDAQQLDGHPKMLWGEMAMRLSNDAVEGEEAATLTDLRRVADSLKTNTASLQMKLPLGHDGHAPAPRPAVSEALQEGLSNLLAAYLELHEALSGDRSDQAQTALTKVAQAVSTVEAEQLLGPERGAWERHARTFETILSGATEATDIESQRQAFALLSEELRAAVAHFSPPAGQTLYEMKCPMAFDGRGAVWLEADRELDNPYFGAAMLKCGEVISVFQAASEANEGGPEHGHDAHE